MNNKRIAVNGVDASSGGYLGGGLTAGEVAAVAREERGAGRPGRDDAEGLDERRRRDTEKRLGPMAGTRPDDLASAGWGVVFASDSDPAVAEALQPLLDLRARQAGDRFQRLAGHEGYRVGSADESVRSFLKRRRVLPSMPADPQRVPYYLMLVGGPESVPFRFQYGLDVVYAVGRLWFEDAGGMPDLDAFDRYARAVVASEEETGRNARSRQAMFLGPANDDDRATALSLGDLVRPLGSTLAAVEDVRQAGWDVQTLGPERASKGELASLLNGPSPPALLFTASHGVAFPKGHPRSSPTRGPCSARTGRGPGNGPG